MSGTVLDNHLVRDYLNALDAACLKLPAAQARELREQITAHLDEALPPGATEDEIRAELDRLGPPRGLAAEAAGPRTGYRGLRKRLSRIRWWAWTLIAAVAAVLIAGAVLLNLMRSAEPLHDYGGLAAWWFYQDGARSVTTQAGKVTQWTTPERYGQQQGFMIEIDNDSDWTQTILGQDLGPDPLIGSFFEHLSLGISGPPAPGEELGPDNGQLRWVLPASIPPHSARFLRVLWISGMCMARGSKVVVTDLFLRVRVGVITRTEDIHLNYAWAMSGATKPGCAGGLDPGEWVILGS